MPTATRAKPRRDENVTIDKLNTITLSDGEVFVLKTKYCGAYYYNILNLGPCTVYIRADHDPAPNDPHSETLPPYCADNLVLVPEGTEGLRFIAGPPCVAGNGLGPPPCKTGAKGCVATITVRLVPA